MLTLLRLVVFALLCATAIKKVNGYVIELDTLIFRGKRGAARGSGGLKQIDDYRA